MYEAHLSTDPYSVYPKVAQIFLLQSFRFPVVLHNIFEAWPGGLKKNGVRVFC